MFFSGMIASAYKGCADETLVAAKNLKRLTIQNAVFNELFVTRNADKTYTTVFPTEWDYDTVLHALFENNLMAGNIFYYLNNIDSVKIKRRKSGTYNWITLFEIQVETEEDLNFERYDKFCDSNQEYEYALVPVMNGVEGDIAPNSIKSEFSGVFIMEKDASFHTDLEVDKGSITKNRPSNVVTTLSGKYAHVIRNGNTNYTSSTLTAMWLPLDLNNEYTTDGAFEYRESLMEFLTNDRPKILKLSDGRSWMISVIGQPSETAEGYIENAVRTSFDWVEIGSVESNEDMYVNGFIDVETE